MSWSTILSYVTFDVFTTQRYAGNPLALVQIAPSQTLTQEQKQIIAREFNYSETVFLHENSSDSNEHRIDIFMPDVELPFAGHPAIGAAHFLTQASTGPREDQRVLLTKAGRIFYRHDSGEEIIRIVIPHDVHLHQLQLSGPQLCDAGIPESTAANLIGTASFMSIVRGMTFAILELPSLTALSAVSGSVNASKVASGLDNGWYNGKLGTEYFVRRGKDHKGKLLISSRMIMRDGAVEDSATGSGASALSVFLSQRLRKESPARHEIVYDFEIEQGVDMGRPSKIHTEITLNGGTGEVCKVTLGGSAVKIMEGTLTV